VAGRFGRFPRGRDAQMPRDEFDRVTVQLTAGDHLQGVE
jgi:hypothetical protein